MKLLSNVLLIWFAISFLFGGVMFMSQSTDKQDTTNHLALQLTDMTPGADVHVNATIAPAPTVLSPLTQTPCVAARVEITYTYRSGKHTNTDHLFTLFSGPDPIPLLALNTPLVLPRVLWNPNSNVWKSTTQTLTTLPTSISAHIAPERLTSVYKKNPKHFTIQEWVLTENMEVFIAGALWGREPSGVFILGPDPVIKKLIIHPGTQSNSIHANHRASDGGFGRGLFLLILGFVTLAIFIYRKRTAAKASI